MSYLAIESESKLCKLMLPLSTSARAGYNIFGCQIVGTKGRSTRNLLIALACLVAYSWYKHKEIRSVEQNKSWFICTSAYYIHDLFIELKYLQIITVLKWSRFNCTYLLIMKSSGRFVLLFTDKDVNYVVFLHENK